MISSRPLAAGARGLVFSWVGPIAFLAWKLTGSLDWLPHSGADCLGEDNREQEPLRVIPLVLLGRIIGSLVPGKVFFRTMTQNSNSVPHYAVGVGCFSPTLCSRIGHLSVEADREQSALFYHVGSYMSSLGLPPSCASGGLSAQSFYSCITRIWVTFSESCLKAVCALRFGCWLSMLWSSYVLSVGNSCSGKELDVHGWYLVFLHCFVWGSPMPSRVPFVWEGHRYGIPRSWHASVWIYLMMTYIQHLDNQKIIMSSVGM